MKPRTYIFVFLNVCVICVTAKQLPPTFKRCSITDKNVNDCLRENVEDAIRNLANGWENLKIPALEPLEIPALNFGQGNGPVRVEQSYRNVKIHGLTASKVLKYTADFDKIRFDADSLSPRLEVLGDYNMSGNVLLFLINGKGKCNVTLTNLRLHHTLLGQKQMKKGKEYFKLTDYIVKIDPERVHYNYENLFDGDKQLTDMLNQVFNDNWHEIYQDVRSGYELSFGHIFLQLGQLLFKRVPFDDIFLP